MPSIGSVLESRKGVGPGFDTLRIGLAFAVVGWHSFHIVEGEPHPLADLHFFWFPGYAILSMFFALSGFLITASATRLSLGNFILNRGLRIVPALLVEVVLSAIVLGAIFTTLPLSEYFRSDGFWRYFGNVAGFVSLTLPGVFETNPDHSVNTSLWTIPFEIGCYVLMAGLILCKCLHRPRLVLSLCAAFWRHCRRDLSGRPGVHVHFQPGSAQLFCRQRRLAPVHLIPARYRHLSVSIRYRIQPSRGAGVPFVLPGRCCRGTTARRAPQRLRSAGVGISHGLYRRFRSAQIALFHRGDYSYGVYLYGYPLQQTIVAVWPSHISVAVLFALAALATTAFAMFSWHVIELPILKLRRRFSFVAGTRIQALEPVAMVDTRGAIRNPDAAVS